jgi:hypothetical protein
MEKIVYHKMPQKISQKGLIFEGLTMKIVIGFFVLLAMVTSCTVIKPNYNNTEFKKEVNLLFNEHGSNPIGPFINIEINNKSYTAFFDTGNGNGILLLKQHFIDELNLEIIGESKFGTLIETYNAPMYKLPEFVIDNKVIIQNGNVELLPEKLGKYEIIMGLSVFDDYNILLSYKKRKYIYMIRNKI